MAVDRRRDEFERDVRLAWHTSAMVNAKKLHPLDRYLPKDKAKVMNFKPSLDEQRANLLEISRRYKIPIKEVPAA